ncbi:unnamed protein product [Sphacelaria rigidula]
MICVRSPRECSHEGCSKGPWYGVAGSRIAEYCAQHADEGMICVRPLRECSTEGCSKVPSHGIAGTRKAEYCAQHARDDMVNVKNRKRCAHESCCKRPSYGVPGTRTAEYCAQHAADGMINVERKRCVHEGCTEHPSFGVAGSRRADLCARHANEGLVHVRPGLSPELEGARGEVFREQHTTARGGLLTAIRKRLFNEECSEAPAYGSEGAGKPKFGCQNAEDAMVYVDSRKCLHEGSSKVPSYGTAGTRETEFCRQHSGKLMVDVGPGGCVPRRSRSNPPASHLEVKPNISSLGADDESNRYCCESVANPLKRACTASSGSNNSSVQRPRVAEDDCSRITGRSSLGNAELHVRPLGDSAKVKTEVSAS